jgi:hypothetical protein
MAGLGLPGNGVPQGSVMCPFIMNYERFPSQTDLWLSGYLSSLEREAPGANFIKKKNKKKK